MRLFSWWGAFCVTVVAALAVSLLLGGCASRPTEQTAASAGNSWGRCDHARIATSQIFCRQTIAEPVAGTTR